VPRPVLKNPATWFGATVPLIMLISAANNFPGFRVTSSWESVLSASGVGVTLAAPVLAAGAAAATGSSERWLRAIEFAASRELLTRVLMSIWPLIAGAACGYVLVVWVFVNGSSPQGFVPRAALVVVAFVCSVVVSTLVGSGVGLLLPSAVAVPLAGVGSYVTVVLALIVGEPSSGNLLGYSMFTSPQSLSSEIAATAFVSPLLLALACILAFATAAIRRRTIAVAMSIAVIGAGYAGAATVAAGLDFPPVVARDAGEMRCADELCLWPELEGERERLRGILSGVDAVLAEEGIARPGVVSAKITPTPEDGFLTATPDLEWDVEPGTPGRYAMWALAIGLQRSAACTHGEVPTGDQYREADRAVAALGIALGVPVDLASVPYRSDLLEESAGWGAADVYATLRIETSAEGFAVYRDWLEEEKPCM
jgi:hypothetical protein